MRNYLQGKNALIAAALLILVGWFVAGRFVYAPLADRIEANQATIGDLKNREQVGLRARAMAAKLEKEIAELKRKNAELAARLPKREDYTALMAQVTDTAEEILGLNVQEIGRTPPRPFQNGVYVGRLQLRLQGTFRDLYRFLAYLETIKRFSRIARLELTPAQDKEAGGKVEVSAGVELEFYFQGGGR